MSEQSNLQYARIALAIEYISEHFKEQPALDEIAKAIQLSPFYFQRLFVDWAGVSPKKFIQYLSIEHAKTILKREQSSLLDVAYRTGLSGASRLHDLFITIEGMTPGEYKNGGENLIINYAFAASPFGKIMVASTSKGVCHMVFDENEQQAVTDLILRLPKAKYQHSVDEFQQAALGIFKQNGTHLDNLKLHLNGTPFQLKVWESLLKIPLGGLTTYGDIAQRINNPNASRAVGTAIGSNPIAFLIPCHRVIRASGNFGGYRWGGTKKSAIIGWEAARVEIKSTQADK